jgi:hypothetical protein
MIFRPSVTAGPCSRLSRTRGVAREGVNDVAAHSASAERDSERGQPAIRLEQAWPGVPPARAKFRDCATSPQRRSSLSLAPKLKLVAWFWPTPSLASIRPARKLSRGKLPSMPVEHHGRI